MPRLTRFFARLRRDRDWIDPGLYDDILTEMIDQGVTRQQDPEGPLRDRKLRDEDIVDKLAKLARGTRAAVSWAALAAVGSFGSFLVGLAGLLIAILLRRACSAGPQRLAFSGGPRGPGRLEAAPSAHHG